MAFNNSRPIGEVGTWTNLELRVQMTKEFISKPKSEELTVSLS